MGDEREPDGEGGQSLYRKDTPGVAPIRVLTETELRFAWAFEVEVGPARMITVRLSFADYEYWCHGTAGPARVIELVVGLLARLESPLLARASFDAARARHEHPGFDAMMSEIA